MMAPLSFSLDVRAVTDSATQSQAAYVQRGVNTLQQVIRDHFARFAAEYDSRYAKDLGNFRLVRLANGPQNSPQVLGGQQEDPKAEATAQ